MRLSSGTRFGPYEISSLLGVGGMGEVYRARDTRLGRDVALKILPEVYRQDPDRLARFEREARSLAALSHPNIGSLYGVEEQPGVHALVMELVEGETLAERLEAHSSRDAHGSNVRRGLPIADAIAIARQIADALDAAHDRGIIHRDLKPTNIKITPTGLVKVLDFGLAKGFDEAGHVSDLSHSPTITVTHTGVIMGTAAYMSPEQARGKTIDKRADIWAFGCVLYEMLCGQRAFGGDSVSEILAEVLKSEPDWDRLPAATPRTVRRLLHRCLQKERSVRLRDIADARFDLEDAHAVGSDEAVVRTTAAVSSRRPERLAWGAAVVVLGAALAALGVRALRATPPADELRLDIATPPTTDAGDVAVSPNGQEIAFVATSEGRPRLWVRSLASTTARPLAGTEEPGAPFWSPDARSLGFFSGGQLKRIDPATGAVQTLAPARGAFAGGSWNRDGVILFVPTATSPVYRVAASGGEPVAVTRLGAGETGHGFPVFLPDDRHFFYRILGGQRTSIAIGSLDGSEGKRLLESDTEVAFTSGHVLYTKGRTLLAQSFDVSQLVLRGDPFTVAEGVAGRSFSAAANGPIVYRAAPATAAQRQLAWVDRTGKQTAINQQDLVNPNGIWMSPDGRRAVMQLAQNGNADIWSFDLLRGVLSRLTTNPRADNFPVSSPDGAQVVYSSNRKGLFDLYLTKATGIGDEKELLVTDHNKNAVDWSADGRFILFRDLDPKTGFDLWALPLQGERKPVVVVQTPFDDRDGQFSPDGHWIAYQSDQSGRSEIYVQPFPGPGDRIQVSSGGGAQVRWRGDGRELFYIALDGRLMAVPMHLESGQKPDVGAPGPLFQTRVGIVVQNGRQLYAVTGDGQRFLMNTLIEETPAPITVIVNWKARAQQNP